MTTKQEPGNNRFRDIWISFRTLPIRVQVWVALILMPVNMASLVFLDEPMGLWIALLANIAMLSNLPIILCERGFTKAMALPHLIPWTILVGVLLFFRPAATGAYDHYLFALLIVNMISLLFDYPDSVAWLRERRSPRKNLP